MKLLQPISGTVDRLAPDGSGVINRPEGKPFLIYNVIPGEEVTATVVKRGPDGVRAKLDSIVVASPDRVAPRCPYAGTCGGCKWQHMDYTRQRQEKLNRLRSTFAEAATECPVESVVASPDQFYYRNRMDFTFGRDGELGLKMPDKWWAALNLETCYLLSPESVEIVNAVREWARSTGLPFWDGKTHAGFFRYLVIREGKFTGERMVTLVTTDPTGLKSLGIDGIPRDFSPAGFVAAIGDRATSIIHGINDGITDLSISDVLVPLKGDPFIHEEINGVRFKITPNAFFQTNSAMAAKLQDEVVRHCEAAVTGKTNATVLDLYCGSGFFSLALAKRSPTMNVVGIEENAEAIACAKENVATNGVSAEYFVSKAEEFDWKSYAPDVVIVDPPRAGMHPKVIETLLEAAPPTIIYISCKYERFLMEWNGTANSAPALSTKYRLADAAALDLFPHTPHIEFVARLELR
ncbi:MAG: 23S rRNA (uracil(1939)-C(5))-methyltransferase RlmD [Candidatus Uhrbacteria bacterium]